MGLGLPFRSRTECLLRRAQRDVDAFAAFYEAHHEHVFVFFVRRLLDPEIAFDLMSESFARALELRTQFRGHTTEEERGWLFAIARSELSHYWRRWAVEKAALRKLGTIERHPLSSADLERVEHFANFDSIKPRLLMDLAALPAEQRRAVELRIVDEVDYAAVAATLGINETAARARVSRGLRALGAGMARDGAADELEATT